MDEKAQRSVLWAKWDSVVSFVEELKRERDALRDALDDVRCLLAGTAAVMGSGFPNAEMMALKIIDTALSSPAVGDER